MQCEALSLPVILALLVSVVWGQGRLVPWQTPTSPPAIMSDFSTSGSASTAGPVSAEPGALAVGTSGLEGSTPASYAFTLSPPHTIWGLSVEEFSYIFLIIGGTAPVLFIIITIIVMKCYSWRRRQRFDKYATQYRTAQELWELERQEYLNSAGTAAANSGRSPNRVPQRITSPQPDSAPVNPVPPVIHTNSLAPQSTVVVAPPHPPHPQHQPGYLASSSNPNVYFKDGGNPSDPRHKGVTQNGDSSNLVLTVTAFNTSADSSPNLTQITDISQDMGSSRGQQHSHQLHSPISEAPSTQNLGSEEAKALAAFDRIYENLDVSLTTSSSGDYSQAPSYIDAGTVGNTSQRPGRVSGNNSSGTGGPPGRDSLHTVTIQLTDEGDASRLNPAFSSSSLSDTGSSPSAVQGVRQGPGTSANSSGSQPTQPSKDFKQQQTTFVNSAFVPDCLHES